MTPVQLSAITQLRHTLHRHPELSMQETETMKILQVFLQENTSLEIHAGEGWFYALKKASASFQSSSNAGPMAFRADMDALPIAESISLPYGSENEGISHKCGHDGHCAVLCGLALELDRRETDRDVYLIFQPGEEIGAGAKRCAELIREKGIAEIYAMHNLGDLYRQGKGVMHDGAQAFEWYQKAAQAGHAIGLEDMGDCYLDGIGVAQNRAEAVRLYRQAAKRGRKSAAQKLHRLGE